jgi:hypothetical protein
MSYRSKYVILDQTVTVGIVFSDYINHSEMAQVIGGKVIGAGFCFIEDNRYVCYGESTSLKVKSRPEEDAQILNKYLGTVHEN